VLLRLQTLRRLLTYGLARRSASTICATPGCSATLARVTT